MNKKQVFLIVGLMSIALIGLIGMQVSWIKHDYHIREERFNQQVTDALNKAVLKLDTRESILSLTQNIPWVFKDSVVEYFGDIRTPSEVHVIQEVEMLDSLMVQKKALVSLGDSLNNQVRILTDGKTEGGNVVVSVNSSNKHQLIEIHQQYSQQVDSKLNAEMRDLEFRKEVAEIEKVKAEKKKSKLEKVIHKMAFEFEQKDIEILDRVDPSLMDSLVGLELSNNGINLPYSFALYSDKADSTIWKRIPATAASQSINEYKANLFPDDIVDSHHYISVGFYETFSYFLNSMKLMLLSSILFTFIIIFIFTYTIQIIFNQKRIDDIKNDFINNMTHEFKTPIATIRLASEAISNPDVIVDKEKIKVYTEIIKAENDRMNSQVENILQIALFDKRAFASDFSDVNMHQIIFDSIEKISLMLESKGGEIITNTNAKNYVIKADARFISVVILNLLDNAIKYSPENPHIVITSSDSENGLLISIQDDGIGMDLGTQKKVFDKFYRVTSGDLHNVKGFGLGLSYVKAIVTAHNGTISIKSELGKGSRFDLVFPVAKS